MKKTKPEILLRRRQFTRLFYKNNHWNLALSILSTVLGAGLSLVISWLLQQTIDLATGSGKTLTLIQLALLALTTLLFCAVDDLIGAFAKPKFISRAIGQYREFAYAELLKKNLVTFIRENTATYLSALSNDVNSIETNYLQKLLDFVGNTFLFLGSLALMLWYSPALTIIALALSLLPLVVSVKIGPSLSKAETQVSQENVSFVSTLKEGLSGFSVIKSFQAEREIYRLFTKSNQQIQEAKCHRLRYAAILTSVGSTIATAVQLCVFLIGCWMALSGWGVTPGMMVVFVNLMNYFNMFISALPDFISNRSACNALIDKLAAVLSVNVKKEGIAIPKRLEHKITIKNLTFGYDKNQPVLHNISTHFTVGKSYAVVGSSGSGKSTLLRLLMAADDSYNGSIYYDNIELRTVNPDLVYELVSLVEQNVFVFDSSILNNITMFRNFPQEQVERAVRLAGLEQLFKVKGDDFLCGENGCNLSGGERQRISIARCLMRQTPVLLVDEATAMLDKETAFQVSSAIINLEGLTRIVVMHTLDEALLRRYDSILVLKNGSIVESGNFDELMEKKGYFYSLYTVSQ